MVSRRTTNRWWRSLWLGTGAGLCCLALTGGLSVGVAREPRTGIQTKVTNRNLVGLSVSNNGYFGNNFANKNVPSFEFPLGGRYHYEHMVRAGLWVGGLVADLADSTGGLDTLVSTATSDGYAMPGLGRESEFNPTEEITECSTLRGAHFCPDAKSQQDFRTSYTDVFSPGNLPQDHVPLHIQVEQETLVWDFYPLTGMVILNVQITNIGSQPIQDLAIGMYSELATGLKDPTLTNPFSGWFRQKDIGYVDSLRMVTEHRHGTDYPWCGITLIGTIPALPAEVPHSFNWWAWNPNVVTSDPARYRLMTNGEKDDTGGFEADNDPTELLSIGPLSGLFHPGESITVSFAFLGGEADPRTGGTPEADLIFNARQARAVFELQPTAVYPGDTNNDGLVDARDILPLGIFYGQQGSARADTSTAWGPHLMAAAWTTPQACYADCNGDGRVDEEDVRAIVTNWHATRAGGPLSPEDPGTICRQLLATLGTDAGSTGASALRRALERILTQELEHPLHFALEPNRPNPFDDQTTFAFVLPSPTRLAVLDIFDAGGRLRWRIRRPDLSEGFHTMTWKGLDQDGKSVPVGLYFFRLTAGDHHAEGKITRTSQAGQ